MGEVWNISAGSSPYYGRSLADPDIRLGLRARDRQGEANLICFSVSRVYFFVEGEPTSIAKLGGGGLWPDLPYPGSDTAVAIEDREHLHFTALPCGRH